MPLGGLSYFVDSYQRAVANSRDYLAALQESPCLLYTSDAADERSSVDLGGRRIIKKKKTGGRSEQTTRTRTLEQVKRI